MRLKSCEGRYRKFSKLGKDLLSTFENSNVIKKPNGNPALEFYKILKGKFNNLDLNSAAELIQCYGTMSHSAHVISCPVPLN